VFEVVIAEQVARDGLGLRRLAQKAGGGIGRGLLARRRGAGLVSRVAQVGVGSRFGKQERELGGSDAAKALAAIARRVLRAGLVRRLGQRIGAEEAGAVCGRGQAFEHEFGEALGGGGVAPVHFQDQVAGGFGGVGLAVDDVERVPKRILLECVRSVRIAMRADQRRGRAAAEIAVEAAAVAGGARLDQRHQFDGLGLRGSGRGGAVGG